MTVTDERVDLGVDLDKAVPCQFDTPCTTEAKWIKWNQPCGHQRLQFCTRHHIAMQDFFNAGPSMCSTCWGLVLRLGWREL
jgi:hypothetical protein